MAREKFVNEIGRSSTRIIFYGTKVNKTALGFKCLCAARVLLFCFGVVFISDLVLQLYCVMISSLVFLGVVLVSHEHLWTEKSVKVLHILNEVTVLVTAVCQLVFSAYVRDLKARSYVGKALIWLILATLCANFLYLFASVY